MDRLKNVKVVKTIFNEQEITFITEQGNLIYYAEGDCCSSSYIESIDDIDVLQDCIVYNVDEVSGRQDDSDEDNVKKWTFYKFLTSKGRATISFRNESNGYYDGCLEYSSKSTYAPGSSL